MPDVALEVDGLRLAAHLARPAQTDVRLSTPGLVVCHGLPSGAGTAGTAGKTFAQLADRVATDTGWICLSFGFRGTGTSQGDFSLAGWVEDLRGAIGLLRGEGADSVWLAGFSVGGTIAIHVAATDPDVSGVAALGAPSDLSGWVADPSYLLALAREVGVIRPTLEPDLDRWLGEIKHLDPLASAARVPPRPLLVIHGSADPTVPAGDARAFADAAKGCELHVIPMADHRLRHDPRAIALLLGWLDRQVS